MDIDEFLLSAWRVSQCDRLAMYGRADYEKRIHRLRPDDAPGAPVLDGGAETPPDVGFVGEGYAGVLFLGMNPGRGVSRGPNERDYFAEVTRFSKEGNEQSALRIGKRVLAKERRMALRDPWPLHSRFMLPLLDRVRTLGVSLTIDHVARLNVARSKTIDDTKNLTPRMARICFDAHTREQIVMLAPRVIVCRYKGAAGWLRAWGTDLLDGVPVAVVGGLAPSRRDMDDAAATVAEALAG